MKLDGVKFYDKDNSFVNEYKLTYDPTPLGPRNGSSQDFWGYYNGKTPPHMISFGYVGYVDGRPVYTGGDRKTDFDFMKAASLTKITYPTGGYTTFEYEPNRYLNRDLPPNMIEVNKELKVWAVNRLPECPPTFLNTIPVNNTVDFTITDTLPGDVAEGRISAHFTDYKTPTSSVGMTVRITDITPGVYQPASYYYQLLPADRLEGKTYTDNIRIWRGHTYRVEAFTNSATGSNSSPCNSPYIEVGIYYKYLRTTVGDSVVPEQAGGLRIKSITNFEIDNKVLSKKVYEYGDGSHPLGVGNLISNPNRNFYFYPQLYAYSPGHKDLRTYVWYTSSSQIELGMARGCPVDYSRVVEKQVDAGTGKINGKSEYYYSSVGGDMEPRSGYKFPYNTIYYPSWRLQKYLLENIQYKWVNGNYIPVKKITTDHQVVAQGKIKTLKVIDNQPDIWSADLVASGGYYVWRYFDKNPQRFLYYNYYVSRGRYMLGGETITDYTDNGDSIKVTRALRYNPQYDLEREITVNSAGREIRNNYRYTGDLDYTTLISKNILSLPVQEEQTIDGKIRSGSILRYNNDGNINEQYLLEVNEPATPLTYAQQAIVPSYYKRKKVLSYHANHLQVKEVMNETGEKTVYLWSYKGQYLIAEIKNADYAIVESILGNTGIVNMMKANPTNSELNSFLAPLRTSTQLKAAMITTYTFDPALGVTSITNPAGLVSYYEYDGMGRLKLIKDNNGKILKLVDYQYQQPVNQ